MEEVIKFLSAKRFYVFLPCGTWFTCTQDQWKDEQLWKLGPTSTGWVGGDFDAKVINAVVERFTK